MLLCDYVVESFKEGYLGLPTSYGTVLLGAKSITGTC